MPKLSSPNQPSLFFTKRQRQVLPTGNPRVKSSFVKVLKPFLNLMRLTGSFPAVQCHQGTGFVPCIYLKHSTVPRKLFCLLYTLGFYVVSCIGVARIIADVPEKRPQASSCNLMDMFVDRYHNVFVPFFVFLCPVTYWLSTGKISAYLASWDRYQIQFDQITSSEAIPLKRVEVILSIVFVALNTGVVTAFAFFEGGNGILDLLAIVASHAHFLWSDFLWILLCRALLTSYSQLSNSYKKALTQITASRGDITVLTQHMSLWLTLNSLIRDTGSVLALNSALHFVCDFTSFIMSLYSVLFRSQCNQHSDLGMLLTKCVASTAIMYCKVDFAHRVGQASDTLILELQRLRSLPSDLRLRREVGVFVNTVAKERSGIDLAGYATVDRGLLTSVIGTMVTYVIVLVQFRTATEDKASQNVTTPK